MDNNMTNQQFNQVLEILKKSIEEIINNTDDKKEMIDKIKELFNI